MTINKKKKDIKKLSKNMSSDLDIFKTEFGINETDFKKHLCYLTSRGRNKDLLEGKDDKFCKDSSKYCSSWIKLIEKQSGGSSSTETESLQSKFVR